MRMLYASLRSAGKEIVCAQVLPHPTLNVYQGTPLELAYPRQNMVNYGYIMLHRS